MHKPLKKKSQMWHKATEWALPQFSCLSFRMSMCSFFTFSKCKVSIVHLWPFPPCLLENPQIAFLKVIDGFQTKQPHVLISWADIWACPCIRPYINTSLSKYVRHSELEQRLASPLSAEARILGDSVIASLGNTQPHPSSTKAASDKGKWIGVGVFR